MPNGGRGSRDWVMTLDDDDDDDEQEELDDQHTATRGTHEQQDGTGDEDDKLAQLDAELASLDEQIRKLRRLHAEIRSERDLLAATIASRAQVQAPLRTSKTGAQSASTSTAATIDYSKSSFPWTAEIAKTAKDIWGVKKWRPGQEGAINATMAGREVVAILPTGGGKSLIFQIPALLASGTSIVVTPLISLMADQVHGLRSRGIAAEMIHASTSQADIKEIMARMLGSAATTKGKGKKKEAANVDSEVVKLVYVTPERIEKSKTFVNTLQKMYDAGLLTRFVIDEAHCLSTMGHDYRPSFLALQRLKVLFPKTPILAVTATAPQNVVSDMLKTLGLPRKTSPGSAALPSTTVVFSAPLYRPNLRYKVLPKPSSAQAALDAIVDWILDHHEGDTGIIYTLSRADSENITKGINAHEKSKGRLKAAFYHAYLEDGDKQRVHDHWRDKRVHVVVATNASFGLGIDNPNVRYVVHHSLAKSLANFQQESGRAGRDGAPADCVTFWRAADASRLSSLTYETFHTGGKEKLYEVVRFAEDKRTCRKILFARYFANAYDSSQSYDADDTPCGHCDNCQRDPATVSTTDITEQAYRALRVIEAATAQRGTLTLPQAADLVRGNGGGAFSTQQAKGKGKGKIDVKTVAGNKVTLNKDETEQMLLQLLVDGYLKEEFHATAYNVTSYHHPATKAMRLTRLDPSEFDAANPPVKLEMDVTVVGAARKKRKTSDNGNQPPARKKSKKEVEIDISDPEDAVDYDEDDLGAGGGFFSGGRDLDEEDEDETEAWLQAQEPSSEPDGDGWSSVKTASKSRPLVARPGGREVLELD